MKPASPVVATTRRFTREIPVRHVVDVCVAGGGPAGVAAAVAAAREGARVFLAEGQGCLGGMGTAGLVPGFMPFGDGVHTLAAGIGTEVLERMLAVCGRRPGDTTDYRLRGEYGIDAEALKRVYDDLVRDAGVAFAFFTHLIDAEREGDRLQTGLFWGKSGIFAVEAAVWIDATGDGDLAFLAGAPCEQGDAEGRMMPGTLCSRWTHVDFEQAVADGLRWGHGAHVEQAWKDGVLPVCDKHLPGVWPVRGDLVGGNIGHTFGVDGTDERSLTRAMVEGRRQMVAYGDYYRRYLKSGFSRMELAVTGELPGIRETRRVMGDYVLILDDFLRRATFDDEIGRNNYAVDIHVMRPDDEAEFARFNREFNTLRMKPGESYGIPYRALTPRGLRNLLVAGRCISAAREMQASIRVMPCCFVTGQAAGVAAAMAAAAGDTRALAAGELRRRLRRLGAYLPDPT